MLVATFVVDDLKWPVSDHQSSGQQQRSLPDPLLPVANVRFAEPKSALLLRHGITGFLELFPLCRVLERLIVFDKRRSRLTRTCQCATPAFERIAEVRTLVVD